MAELDKTCPRCGHSVEPGDQFCDFCGLPLKNNQDGFNRDNDSSAESQYDMVSFPPRNSVRHHKNSGVADQKEDSLSSVSTPPSDKDQADQQADREIENNVKKAKQRAAEKLAKKKQDKDRAKAEIVKKKIAERAKAAENRATQHAEKREAADSKHAYRKEEMTAKRAQKAEQEVNEREVHEEKRDAKQLSTQMAQNRWVAKQRQNQQQSIKTDKLRLRSHHYKIGGVIVGALVVIIVGGYGFGSYYFSKGATLNRIIDQPGKITNSVDNNGNKLSTQQRKKLSIQLNDPKSVKELRHTGKLDREIVYRKTGHQFKVFNRYQLVVNLNETSSKPKHKKIVKKTKAPQKVSSHSLSEHQQVRNLLNDLWSGLNNWTKNGNVRQKVEDYFVGGTTNDSYMHLAEMATVYHKNDYSVDYQEDLQRIEGHQEPIAYFNLTYRFYSGEITHVQKFRWKAQLIKNRNHYLIEWTIGKSKPYYDKVINK